MNALYSHLSFGLALLALLFLPMVGFGCVKDQADDASLMARPGPDDPRRARFGNLSREGYTVEEVDLNQDGQPDQWYIRDHVGLRRIERDINFSGRIDMWQYFDQNDVLVEEEMDLDQDGRVDTVVFYENGVMRRKELTSDFSGAFAIWKYYDNRGRLLRIERDSRNDGRPDVWEYYEDGRRSSVAWDTDGDGQPDSFESD